MINSYLCAIRVITLKHNNEELRNTNGCYLVTQFSSSSTNRLILSELSFLAKVTENNSKSAVFRRLSYRDKTATVKYGRRTPFSTEPVRCKAC